VNKHPRRIIALGTSAFAALAVTLSACSSTLAQEYPAKPVRIIVANPGTGTDFAARWIAQGLSERWGRPVVVENRGGLPITGADLVAKAAPDGYTLHMGQVSSHATPMHLHKRMPFDAVKDFSPVSLVA
jgi:tripartite-type tricarboxylate transporter receptor subunit TctC